MKEIGIMRGLKRTIEVGKNAPGIKKKSYDTSNWSPILLAIASRSLETVDILFDQGEENFHLINSLSKPYDNEV